MQRISQLIILTVNQPFANLNCDLFGPQFKHEAPNKHVWTEHSTIHT